MDSCKLFLSSVTSTVTASLSKGGPCDQPYNYFRDIFVIGYAQVVLFLGAFFTLYARRSFLTVDVCLIDGRKKWAIAKPVAQLFRIHFRKFCFIALTCTCMYLNKLKERSARHRCRAARCIFSRLRDTCTLH